jgi:proline iminopeptidase
MPVVIGYLDENGEEHETSIRRASRERKSVAGPVLPPFFLEFESRLLNDGIAYIRFSNFHPALTADVVQAIESHHDASGLIIDLRGNSGGEMEVTKAIARQLITERTLFSLLTTRNGHNELVLHPKQDAYTGPLVILIDAQSLSASEQFAAGLQATGRAVIVGERSPGNLLGGNLLQLPNDVGFIYPVVQVSTPDGTVLEGRGVIPDMEVGLDRTLLLEGVDPQLEAAVAYLVKELRMKDADPTVQELMVPTDDVTLYTSIAGDPEAGDVLIGIHGGPGMSSDYMASLEQLAGEDLAVVTYDQRGTGRSSSPEPDAANYDLLNYVADLEAIREAAGAERVLLFGHSWGGLVALRYATVHPDKVNSIVLMGSGAPTMEAVRAANDKKAQRLADLQAQGIIPNTITSVSDLLPVYFSDPNFKMPEELKDLHYSPTAEQLTWTALGEFDFTADVAQIHRPVLVLWGKDDPFGPAMVEAVRSALTGAGAKFIVLENCGHFWHECPDAFFAELRDFLELPPAP